MAIDFDPKEQNQVVQKWASMVQRYLRTTAAGFVHGKEGTKSRPGRTEKKLADSIRSGTRKAFGVVDRVSFMFERHGVFVHKGVGRGYEMQGGMVIRTAKLEKPSDDRRPKEWFNPVFERTLPELADKLAEINADAVLNATKILIK